MKLLIIQSKIAVPVSTSLLKKVALEALRLGNKQRPPHKKLKLQSLRVELLFLRSAAMKKLNLQFRQKNKATDVLSFPSERAPLLGSVVIDIQTAARQAKALHHSLRSEIVELFVHGIFHLMGFDHEKRSDERVMRALESTMEQKIASWL